MIQKDGIYTRLRSRAPINALKRLSIQPTFRRQRSNLNAKIKEWRSSKIDQRNSGKIGNNMPIILLTDICKDNLFPRYGSLNGETRRLEESDNISIAHSDNQHVVVPLANQLICKFSQKFNEIDLKLKDSFVLFPDAAAKLVFVLLLSLLIILIATMALESYLMGEIEDLPLPFFGINRSVGNRNFSICL